MNNLRFIGRKLLPAIPLHTYNIVDFCINYLVSDQYSAELTIENMSLTTSLKTNNFVLNSKIPLIAYEFIRRTEAIMNII